MSRPGAFYASSQRLLGRQLSRLHRIASPHNISRMKCQDRRAGRQVDLLLELLSIMFRILGTFLSGLPARHAWFDESLQLRKRLSSPARAHNVLRGSGALYPPVDAGSDTELNPSMIALARRRPTTITMFSDDSTSIWSRPPGADLSQAGNPSREG